jgi:hypothetical protein
MKNEEFLPRSLSSTLAVSCCFQITKVAHPCLQLVCWVGDNLRLSYTGSLTFTIHDPEDFLIL